MEKILDALLHSTNDAKLKAGIIHNISKHVLSNNSSLQRISALLNICLTNPWAFHKQNAFAPSMYNLLEVLISNGSLCMRYFTSIFETDLNNLCYICSYIPTFLSSRLMYFFVPSWIFLQKICATNSCIHEVPSLLSDICVWHLPLSDSEITLLDQALELFLRNYSILVAPISVLSFEQVTRIVTFIAKFETFLREEDSKIRLMKQICNNMSHMLFLLMVSNKKSCTTESYHNFEDIFLASKSLIVDMSPSTYSPLASLLTELKTAHLNDMDAYENAVCFCINGLVEDIHCIDKLRETILRVITWSTWNTDDILGCIDIWVIGILSEFGHQNSCSLFSNPQVYEHLLSPLLNRTLETCSIIEFKSIALIQVMTFLLVIIEFLDLSNEDVHYCQNLTRFLRRMISTDDLTVSSNSEIVASTLCKGGVLIKLATSLSNTSPHSDNRTKNAKIVKLFELLARKFPRQNIDAATICLKAYNVKNLLFFRSRAGFLIQKSWKSWDDFDSKSKNQPENAILKLAGPESRTVSKLPGLRNKGNTCYANAAIQLLYHCSDFREALLTSSSLSPILLPSSQSRNVENISSGISSQFGNENSQTSLWPVQVPGGNPRTFGLLHKTLMELFSTLSNAKMQSARDPSAVLTLSKPSHFIQGEQQDSVEYLNYLLDRLHEEELKSRQNPEESKQINLNDPRKVGNEPMKIEKFHSSEDSPIIPSPSDTPDHSTVKRLFGGKLSRLTICAQCKHVSSAELEDFICLFLPIESAVPECSKTQVEHDNFSIVEIASLLRKHFSNSERITGAGECESCGLESTRERQLSLRCLPPHVLICLNMFAYSRATRSCHKLNYRVRINEQLSVSVANSAGSVRSTSLILSGSSSLCSDSYLNQSRLDPTGTDLQSTPLSDTIAAETINEMDVDSDKNQFQVYNLQGMILHHGMSLSGGHYTCAAKVDMNWVSFDDCSTEFTSLEQINRQQYATPYLLLYSKV